MLLPTLLYDRCHTLDPLFRHAIFFERACASLKHKFLLLVGVPKKDRQEWRIGITVVQQYF